MSRIVIAIGIAILLSGLGYGLSLVPWPAAFSCPAGQHAYVEGYTYIPITTKYSTSIVPLPIMGCEENT